MADASRLVAQGSCPMATKNIGAKGTGPKKLKNKSEIMTKKCRLLAIQATPRKLINDQKCKEWIDKAIKQQETITIIIPR